MEGKRLSKNFDPYCGGWGRFQGGLACETGREEDPSSNVCSTHQCACGLRGGELGDSMNPFLSECVGSCCQFLQFLQVN